MRYLRNVESPCEQFASSFYMFVSKIQKIDELNISLILRTLATFIDFRYLHVCVQNT